MGINLEKSLINNKRKLLSSEESIALSKMNDMEKNHGKDLSVLRSKLGMWKENTKTAQNAKGKLKLYETYPADRIFQEADIKKLCCTYGLRFLRSSLFNGELDDELPKKIEDFEKKYGCEVHKHNSFIAAPKESFKLSKRPKDPLFFVQIDNDSKHYFLVHKWGNDISPWRFITNLFVRNILSAFLTIPVTAFILTFCVKFFLFHDNQFVKASPIEDACVVGGISIFIGFILILMADMTVNSNKWDSEYTD